MMVALQGGKTRHRENRQQYGQRERQVDEA